MKAIALSELIYRLYASAMNNSWSGFLDEMATITGANKAFFFVNSLKEDTPLLMEYKSSVNHEPEVIHDYQTRFIDDPFYHVVRYAPEGSVIDFKQHINIADYRDTQFYKDILATVESFRAVASVLSRDGNHESLFAICRGEEQPDFTDNEIELIRTLTPHLRQAVNLYKQLQIGKAKSELSERIINNIGTPLAVCDENKKLVFVNEKADKIFRSHPHIEYRNSYINFKLKGEQNSFSEAIKNACNLFDTGISVHKSFSIDSGIDLDHHIMTISPLLAKTSLNSFDFPACLLTLSKKKTIDWKLIKSEYALSTKEVNLVEELYNNKKLQDLTQNFNVSYNTLKFHLKSIFAKMDVRSQTELMILLNRFSI